MNTSGNTVALNWSAISDYLFRLSIQENHTEKYTLEKYTLEKYTLEKYTHAQQGMPGMALKWYYLKTRRRTSRWICISSIFPSCSSFPAAAVQNMTHVCLQKTDRQTESLDKCYLIYWAFSYCLKQNNRQTDRTSGWICISSTPLYLLLSFFCPKHDKLPPWTCCMLFRDLVNHFLGCWIVSPYFHLPKRSLVVAKVVGGG